MSREAMDSVDMLVVDDAAAGYREPSSEWARLEPSASSLSRRDMRVPRMFRKALPPGVRLRARVLLHGDGLLTIEVYVRGLEFLLCHPQQVLLRLADGTEQEVPFVAECSTAEGTVAAGSSFRLALRVEKDVLGSRVDIIELRSPAFATVRIRVEA